MIILDTTGKSLEVLFGAAATTTNPTIVASYVDVTTTTYAPGATDVAGSGTTAVTAAAAPAASTQRQVKYLSVYNGDTVAHTATVRVNNSSTMRILVKVTLAVGYTLSYTDGVGFKVTDASGVTITGSGTGSVSGLTPATAGNIIIDTGSAWSSVPHYAMRRRNINGDMRIDQANAGASVASNSTASNIQAFSVDQWFSICSGSTGVYTAQRSTSSPPAGFSHFVRLTTTTADASPGASTYYLFGTRIEGLDLVDFKFGSSGAVTFTTSIQLRSSLTGTFSGSFHNITDNRVYIWTCSISSANTWTPVTITVAGDVSGTWNTSTDIGLMMYFDLGCGSSYRSSAGSWGASTYFGATGSVSLVGTNSATLDITGVQIEKGSVATPYEWRDYQSELARCQRYYAKSYKQTTAPSSATTEGAVYLPYSSAFSVAVPGVYFPVTMRAVPSCAAYRTVGGTGWDDTIVGAITPTFSVVSDRGFGYVAGSAGTTGYYGHWTASARL